MDNPTDWPTPQEYNEAVQHPSFCFSDKALQASTVELNQIGLPRPMTGAFASVYKLSGGGTSWAVRCFLEFRPDLKERYYAINDALQASQIDAIVGFNYLEKGIRVKGRWFPILKMDWVEGEPLEKYVERNVRSTARLAEVHKHFINMVQQLSRAGIAHGDLQHGNLLVADGQLKLIDYDGMYVPALQGKVSAELGHRNFQHPTRSHQLFDSSLDNFSAWLIDTSLKSLVIDGSLWRELKGGDDALIFRFSDLSDPENSLVFNTLLEHESREVNESARLLRKVIGLRADLIPEFRSDEAAIDKIYERQNMKIIGDADEAKSPLTDTDKQAAIIDYDRWLEAQKRSKKQRNRSKRSLMRKLATRLRALSTRFWRSAMSSLAPLKWASDMLDEGDREYSETNYVRAVKLYNEVAEYFRVYAGRDKHILCESLVKLGYCYIDKGQYGTAAHYFRECQKVSYMFQISDYEMRSSLLLAATYYELGQSGRTLTELSRGLTNLAGLINVVRAEKPWSFGRRLTLPAMLVDLGHSYLHTNDFASSGIVYGAAIEVCCWVADDPQKSRPSQLIVARANMGLLCGRSDQEIIDLDDSDDNPARPFFQLLSLMISLDLEDLRQLFAQELRGVLRSDRKFAELIHYVASVFERRKENQKAELAYNTALSVYRTADDDGAFQFKIADCLFGLNKQEAAIKTLSETGTWQKMHGESLLKRLNNVDGLAEALMVATVIFYSDQHKLRYGCLDKILARIPVLSEFALGRRREDELKRSLESVLESKFGSVISFAELALEIARDLKRKDRFAESAITYSIAFKSFQKVGASEAYGSSIIECILGSTDLDGAARLLLESGNLESMVRLMINVMVKQGEYKRELVTDLVVRVLNLQLEKPFSSVTEGEIKVSLELLQWCTDSDVAVVGNMRLRVAQWMETREISVAHNLVEQGKFSSALAIFEKYEGLTGANVIAVMELWIMRYLSLALVDSTTRGRLPVADGYSFGCAVELIGGLKKRGALSPGFALQLAELIRASRTSGAERYVHDVLQIFIEAGSQFEEASARISEYLGAHTPKSPNASIKLVVDYSAPSGDPSVDLKFDGSVLNLTPPPMTRREPSYSTVDLWRQLNRVFFMIDREQLVEAVNQLRELQELSIDQYFLAETCIAMGYCCFLLNDEAEAERAYKKGVRIGKRIDPLLHSRIALAIAILASTTLDRARLLRTLSDPMMSKKDIFRQAASVLGRNLHVDEQFADAIGISLYERACEQESANLQEAARRNYRAALAILGIANSDYWPEVVDCLDATNQIYRAANVLAIQSRGLADEERFKNLLTKLAERRIRNKGQTQAIMHYERFKIPFSRFINAANQNRVLKSIHRVLSSPLPPTRLFLEIHTNMLDLYRKEQLTREFCQQLSEVISKSVAECEDERRARCKQDVLKIAHMIQRVDADSAVAVMNTLDSFEAPDTNGPLFTNEKPRN